MAEQQKQSKYAVITVQGPSLSDMLSDGVSLGVDTGHKASDIGFSYSPVFQRHSTRSRLLTHAGPTVVIDLMGTEGIISRKQYRIVVDDQLRPEIVPCEPEIPDIFCDDVEPEADPGKGTFSPK